VRLLIVDFVHGEGDENLWHEEDRDKCPKQHTRDDIFSCSFRNYWLKLDSEEGGLHMKLKAIL
jgi:hypothetical protein